LRDRTGRERNLDANLAEHADDGLRDRFVIDVAVVRRVERDGEAVRIAGFCQQFLRPGDVRLLRVGVEFKRAAIDERRGCNTGRDRLAAHDDLLELDAYPEKADIARAKE